MSRRLKTWIGFLIALVVVLLLTRQLPLAPSAPQAPSRVLRGTPAPSPTAEPRAGAESAPRGIKSAYGRDIGFRTHELFVEHYRKHGSEFAGASMEDYLRLAQALRDRPVGGGVLELVRADGVTTRFDRTGGTFLAFNPDGTIRTFFRPRDGENYFRRQALREAR
jgi:hypothetical protein